MALRWRNSDPSRLPEQADVEVAPHYGRLVAASRRRRHPARHGRCPDRGDRGRPPPSADQAQSRLRSPRRRRRRDRL